MLCAVIILFAALLLTRKKSLLIDYLPKDASFWFWQKGGGYDARATEFLELLGFDSKASSILEGRKHDIVIYLKDDEWYRLTADGLEGEPSGESAELFRVLTSSHSATIVGSVSADYICPLMCFGNNFEIILLIILLSRLPQKLFHFR